MRKPNTRQSFLKLFQLSLKHYFLVLKSSMFFIFAMVVVKDISQIFYNRLESFYVDIAMDLIAGVLLIFLWSCSLRVCENFYKGESAAIRQIFTDIIKLLPRILLVLLGFLVIFVIFFMFAHAVGKQALFFEFTLFMLPVFFYSSCFSLPSPMSFCIILLLLERLEKAPRR